MKKYTFLDGEEIYLESLEPEEQRAIATSLANAANDPNGKAEGNYFALLRLTKTKDALLVKYQGRLTPKLMGEPCYRILHDIAARAGIRQGLVRAS